MLCLQAIYCIRGRLRFGASFSFPFRTCASAPPRSLLETEDIPILDSVYKKDAITNINARMINLIGQNLHLKPFHPLCFLKMRMVDYFNKFYRKRSGNPLFAVLDNLPPVVSLWQQFDSLLIPTDHPSRSRSDTFYVNSDYVLRAHMTAHQLDLIKQGFDHFLMIGDVYRRDAIDRSHFPVFHQLDGVCLFTEDEVKREISRRNVCADDQFDSPERSVEDHLKHCLEGLVCFLFGPQVSYRWVDAYFPFTDPSWELEIEFCGEWMEVLGCGIIQQPILVRGGLSQKVGWAFGLGLERIAMKLYDIQDIRLFWSRDPGFMAQFANQDYRSDLKFRSLGKHPPCFSDLSFWLPAKSADVRANAYSANDFYDLVRSVGGEVVEEVKLIDEFVHPKTQRISHCYRILYRHPSKTFSQAEVNELHLAIAKESAKQLGVELRTSTT